MERIFFPRLRKAIWNWVNEGMREGMSAYNAQKAERTRAAKDRSEPTVRVILDVHDGEVSSKK